jgi:hypothetical protein
VRRVTSQSWETFVSRIEHDAHGRQTKHYTILKEINKNEIDNLELNPITKNNCLNITIVCGQQIMEKKPPK